MLLLGNANPSTGKVGVICNTPINVKPGGGGGRGIGRDFDIFQKIAVKFPIPRQKCEVKYN